MLSVFHRLIARLRAIFGSRDLDHDLDTELESHVELLAEDFIRRGSSPEEARRLARIELGGVQQLREAHRETRALPFLDTLFQDLRYAFRMLRHNPGFATFTILIVGLGIGVSATTFSVVNTLMLRPLPFPDAKRLVWIGNRSDDGLKEWSIQVGHFLDMRNQSRSFSDLAAYFTSFEPGDAKIDLGGEVKRLSSLDVTQNFFSFLGVSPILGRTFNDEECKWNGPGAAMLSYGMWKQRYGSDPNILGRTLTVNDSAVTIVGVLPPSFDFGTVFAPGSQIDLFRPMPLTPETSRWGNTLGVIGRLKPGATIEGARAELQVMAPQLEKEHRDRNTLRPMLSSMEDHVTGRLRQGLLVLSWAVAMLMLIVCANVANLQLARGAARQKEMAVRAAIGAGPRRLIRQMLTESIALSTCGGLLGLLLAFAGTSPLAHIDEKSVPLLSTVRMDTAAVIFSLVAAFLTGLLFGLVPAIQVGFSSVHDSLKDSSRSASAGRRHSWIRSTLVVSEVVFACVLLVGAGLLTRSFLKVMDVNLGFQPERAAAIRIDRPRSDWTVERQSAYFTEVLDRVRSLPGITEAGLTDVLPLVGDRSWEVTAKGKIFAPGHYPEGYIRVVSEGYLHAMGIPVRAGRGFTEQDAPGSDRVALVNETLARTLWPGENPIGQIFIGEGRGNGTRRVVGVVADVRHRALEQESGCEFYIPIRQTRSFYPVYLVVRTALPPSSLTSSIRVALHSIAPEVSGSEFKTIQDLVDKSVSPRRFVLLLLAGFSLFALILASLGIYAVISYWVNQRSAELGIRMALGASAGRLQARIMLQTLSLACVGLLIGSIAAWALSRAMGSLLFGVTFSDPLTFAAMWLVLIAAAALAGYLPSLRISRIDPIAALRAN